jgi:hypothetical protein
MRCTTDGAAVAAIRRRGWARDRRDASLVSPRNAGWAKTWGNTTLSVPIAAPRSGRPFGRRFAKPEVADNTDIEFAFHI